MIKINNLTKIINNKIILNNISVCFEEGKIYGLVGKNGSGKTMFLRAICGLIQPSSGGIVLPEGASFGVLIETPGFMFEQSAIFNLEYLSSLNKKIKKERIIELLKTFDLFDCRKNKVKKFSLGMQQKLGIIQAIMEYPSILILDEPFNALDDKSLELVKETIININKTLNTTIFIASHDKNSIEELCDRVINIKNGEIES